MKRIRLAATALALTLVAATAATAAPEPGFTIYETGRHYIAINHTTGEHLTIQKISMHEELNRQVRCTVCAEDVVFTGPATKTVAHADGERTAIRAGSARIERPVVIRLGGTADREISGVIVYPEPGDTMAARHSSPPGPRH